jgi:salicyloyl-CoA 5-hydroxylase
MEDAVALVQALDTYAAGDRPAADAVDQALAAYETERTGLVARIQDSARPSLSWWEHFGRSYEHLPPWQFAFHFFSRSLPESKLRQRDAGFVDAVHRAWQAAHGGQEPLHSPIEIAGGTQPARVVPVGDGAAELASGPLPLGSGPLSSAGPWGVWVSAPDSEEGLAQADETVARALEAGACLVAVGGGTALTRRLICEAARLGSGAVTMLVEKATEDTARTAILSGRADLVGVRS